MGLHRVSSNRRIREIYREYLRLVSIPSVKLSRACMYEDFTENLLHMSWPHVSVF